MKFFCVLSLSLALTIAVGCDSAANPRNVTELAESPGKSGDAVNFGNGVWYFGQTEARFGNALSRFIKDHPELEVVAMASDGTDFGADAMDGTDGYFVVTRKKEPAI